MNAVTVLTRGYKEVQQYDLLVKRNLSISRNLKDKTTPILIFHEGNIIEEHQQHIHMCTPELNIQFVSVNEHAFKKEKEDVKIYAPTVQFPLGYRHMCSFWFVDFWKYVEEYDNILRIDEDCTIDFSIDLLFMIINERSCVFGAWEMDQEFVTEGLNEFTMDFLHQNELTTRMRPKLPSGPYTNVTGFNMKRLRENELLLKYIDDVEKSDYIYTFRWGDLALWGEALVYFFHPKEYEQLRGICYYHGSHNTYIGTLPHTSNSKMGMPNVR